MENKKTRLNHVDVARGIAILCIIIGHLGNYNIARVVFTFHVPIFFLITGYFTSTNGSDRDFIRKKFNGLIVPYICTCIAIILLGTLESLIFYGPKNAIHTFLSWLYASVYGAGDPHTQPFYIKPIGAIWFLWATFWGCLFLKLSQKLRSRYRPVFILSVFLIGYYTKNIIWLPFSIQAGCSAALFLYIGYIYKSNELHFKEMSSEIKTALLIFAVITWGFFIKDFQTFWLVHFDIGRGIIDIVGCLCACCVVLYISFLIQNKTTYLSKGLAFIGKYSIFMLCIHIIELNLFPWNIIIRPLYRLGFSYELRLLVLILCKFYLTITFTYICSKSDFCKKLFSIKD